MPSVQTKACSSLASKFFSMRQGRGKEGVKDTGWVGGVGGGDGGKEMMMMTQMIHRLHHLLHRLRVDHRRLRLVHHRLDHNLDQRAKHQEKLTRILARGASSKCMTCPKTMLMCAGFPGSTGSVRLAASSRRGSPRLIVSGRVRKKSATSPRSRLEAPGRTPGSFHRQFHGFLAHLVRLVHQCVESPAGCATVILRASSPQIKLSHRLSKRPVMSALVLWQEDGVMPAHPSSVQGGIPRESVAL